MNAELRAAAAALARAGERFVAAGLVVGAGGNLSARVGDAVVVTAAGTWLEDLTADPVTRFSVVDLDGRVLEGRPEPSSELLLHLAAYGRRPDIRCVVHLHPQSCLLLDALDEPVVLSTTDHAFYLRRVVSVPYFAPGGSELALAAADGLLAGNCVLLRRHGCSVVADSVDLAARRALNLEEAARASYRALALGRTLPEVPAEVWDWVSELDARGGSA